MTVTQERLPFSRDPELPELNRYERIDTLSHIKGFIPATPEEVIEVMGLQSVIDNSWGVAKHLAEVTIQQNKAGVEDPQRAARKITRNYIGYAQDAHDSTKALKSLQDTLDGVNPELILDRVITPDEPGVLEMLRHFDLHLLNETGNVWKVGYDPQKVKYSKDNPGIMFYAGEAVSAWRVHQVYKAIPNALAEQADRFIFFAKRLVEITEHSPKRLSAIANEGLDQLYGRVPAETQ